MVTVSISPLSLRAECGSPPDMAVVCGDDTPCVQPVRAHIPSPVVNNPPALSEEDMMAWKRWVLLDEPLKDHGIKDILAKLKPSDYSNNGIGLGIFIPDAEASTVPPFANPTDDEDTSESTEPIDSPESTNYDGEDEDKENIGVFPPSESPNTPGLPADVLEAFGCTNSHGATDHDDENEHAHHDRQGADKYNNTNAFYTTETIPFVSPGSERATSPIDVGLEVLNSVIPPAIHSSPEEYQQPIVIGTANEDKIFIQSPELFGIPLVKGTLQEIDLLELTALNVLGVLSGAGVFDELDDREEMLEALMNI